MDMLLLCLGSSFSQVFRCFKKLSALALQNLENTLMSPLKTKLLKQLIISVTFYLEKKEIMCFHHLFSHAHGVNIVKKNPKMIMLNYL